MGHLSVVIVLLQSYATGTVDGGGEGGNFVGALGNSIHATASYGFGTTSNGTPAIDGPDPRPNNIAMVGSGIEGARMLTLDTAGPEWNDAAQLTLNAWDFGNSTQAPALRYADYDGPDGDTYGCGNGSNATIVIPNIVATPTGPMTITCGTTLLPGQGR